MFASIQWDDEIFEIPPEMRYEGDLFPMRRSSDFNMVHETQLSRTALKKEKMYIDGNEVC